MVIEAHAASRHLVLKMEVCAGRLDFVRDCGQGEIVRGDQSQRAVLDQGVCK